MGKASRRKNKEARAEEAAAPKAAKKARRAAAQFVERPFEGLDPELELVAMKEVLPAATLPAKLKAELPQIEGYATEGHGGEEILLVTMLPQLVGALRRADGVLMVAVQAIANSGDASLDIADRILASLELEEGQTFTQVELPEPGAPRLQDILDPEGFGAFEVHSDLEYWIAGKDREDPEITEAIAATKEQLVPMAPVAGVRGAFWARMQREFVRWVRPEAEDKVLAALARLQNRRELGWEGARFVGAFRACGLLIPVFELDRGTEAEELAAPMQAFAVSFEKEIASDDPLTPEERRAKAGIISRQVTLR